MCVAALLVIPMIIKPIKFPHVLLHIFIGPKLFSKFLKNWRKIPTFLKTLNFFAFFPSSHQSKNCLENICCFANTNPHKLSSIVAAHVKSHNEEFFALSFKPSIKMAPLGVKSPIASHSVCVDFWLLPLAQAAFQRLFLFTSTLLHSKRPQTLTAHFLAASRRPNFSSE